MRPLYQSEGVVESVNGEGFSARLLPILNGDREYVRRPEYMDFSYDDLSTPTDRERVEEGAVFYWTVGREMNEAGTIKNVSLVRFRRLPSSSPQQASEARREAQELLDLLGED